MGAPELNSEGLASLNIDVYRYAQVSSFLKAYVESRQRRRRSYSYGVLARDMGLRSKSQLTMIVRGERQPTQDFLLKLAAAIGLSQKELKYLQALVGYRRAKTTQERLHYGNQIQALKPSNEHILLEVDTLKLICRWHNIAILEMVTLKDFRDDPEWIAQRLGGLITKTEAQESFELLLRLGLLQRNESGAVIKTGVGFRSPRDLPVETLRLFHKDMFKQAKHALNTQTVDQRYFTGTMMPVYKKDLKKAAQAIVDFREQFKVQFAQQDGDEVYHLAIQFFGVTDEGNDDD